MNKLYRKSSILLICLGSCLATACSRDSVVGAADPLVGSWEWQETTAPADSFRLTPALAGHTSAVVFDQRGRVRFYQDNAMTGAAQFTLRRRSRQQQLIVYHGYRAHQFFTINGNLLYLRDADEQGRQHVFSRRVGPVGTVSHAVPYPRNGAGSQ